MPKFLITETRRELWTYFYEVEAATKEEALDLFDMGEALHVGDEFIEMLTSDLDIEEDKHDAA